MKNFILKCSLVLAFFAAISLSAQKIDPKAKSILDGVASQYKSKDNVYFKFSYGTGNGKNISKTETGIFYAAKDKYRLKIMGTEQVYDGNKIYNISAEDQEITIAKPTGSEQMFSPLNYIDEYKKGYNVKYAGTVKVNGVLADYIHLSPTTNNGIREVKIFVNGPKKQLVKIEQYGKDGSLSVIAISDYRENQKLNSSMFSFDKSKYGDYLITEI